MIKMRLKYVLLAAVLSWTTQAQTMTHEPWNQLLKTYVSKEGKVSYRGFLKDRTLFRQYLSSLDVPVNEFNTKEEQLAYWINVYNAFTVEIVLQHYPIKSIKDIENVWDIRFVHLGGKTYSLNDVEHKILRKDFNEPRIHFAIVCASVSCPILRNEAYLPSKLEQQLDEQSRIFINDASKNTIAKDKLELSQIFSWFQTDFTRQGSLVEFIQKYSDKKIFKISKMSDLPNITYKVYNWDLNE